MSELLNSSDNNSISENNNNSISENNSIEDVSSTNPPESIVSLNSPSASSQKLEMFDEYSNKRNSEDSESSSSAISLNRFMVNDHDAMMSLPAMSNTIVHTTTTKYLYGKTIDPELSGLLTRRQPKFQPQAPKCAKCEKSVYKAEEIRAANKTFHKLCFKCNNCNKLLETNILTEHQGDLYCRVCYGRNFGPKGYGYGAGAGILSSDSPNSLNNSSNNNNSSISPVYITNNSSLKSTFSSYPRTNSINLANDSPNSVESKENLSNTDNSENIPKSIDVTSMTNKLTYNTSSSMMHTTSSNYQMSAMNHEKRNSTISMNSFTFGGSDKCGRCCKSVYAAEKVVAAGKPYHKLCFTCFSCKKMLSSMNCCDNSDGDIFCKACYGKQYGPKGIGFGIGAGTLHTN